MPGDPLKKVVPGQRREISAATWNALVDAARANRQREQSRDGAAVSLAQDRAVLLVRNTTGDTVDRFGILALSGPIVGPDDSLDQFQSRVTFDGEVPASTDPGKWCVLLEPIPDGEIGRAIVSGVTICQIDVSGGVQDYAEAADGDTSALVASATGTARVLWMESSGSTRWAVVRLGDGAGGSGGAVIVQRGDVTIVSSATTIDFDGVYTTVTESPSGEANVNLVVASATVGGVLTNGPQSIAGLKTLTNLSSSPSDVGLVVTYTDGGGSTQNPIKLESDSSGNRLSSTVGSTTVKLDLLTSTGTTTLTNTTSGVRILRVGSGNNIIVGGGLLFAESVPPTSGGPSIGLRDCGISPPSGIDTTTAGIFAQSSGGVVKLYGYHGDGTTFQIPTSGGTSYTDEQAQDAVGSILTDSSTIDFTYNDGANTITADVKDASVTYAKIQNVSAQYRILARKSSGAGSVEECTLSEILDFVTSAAQGDLLIRGASGWERLGAGTAGYSLRTQGAGANPQWSAAAGGNGLTATATKTATYTAVAGDMVLCDTSGGTFTVSLPSSPSPGDRVGVYQDGATGLVVGRNGKTIDGAASDVTLSFEHDLRVYQYDGTTWRTVAAEGMTFLASPFTCTSTGTFQDSGLDVTLPTAGVYEVTYNVRAVIQVSGNDGWISVRLYNETNSVAIDHSDRLVFYVASGDTYLRQVHTAFSVKFMVTAAGKVIRLDAKRDSSGSPTWTYSLVSSDSNGRSILSYRRVG